MISYAQNHEDVLLARVFRDQPQGTYLDVGANHPNLRSVTRHFYELGWAGINIEPASIFETLARHRPRDLNLNIGLSDREGSLTLFEFPKADGLTTLCRETAESHRRKGFQYVERTVPLRTLRSVCEQYVRQDIDFLSIDVEGHERQVLAGGDWRAFRPRVVVVESTRPLSNEQNHEEWEPILLGADYLFAQFDGINRYYVRAEDRKLLPQLQVPVNVLDYFVPFELLKRADELQYVIDDLRAPATWFAAHDLQVASPSLRRGGRIEFDGETSLRLGLSEVARGPSISLERGRYKLEVDMDLEKAASGGDLPLRVLLRSKASRQEAAAMAGPLKRGLGGEFTAEFSLNQRRDDLEIALHYEGPARLSLRGWRLRPLRRNFSPRRLALQFVRRMVRNWHTRRDAA